ncbi:MAG: EscU/YscU/HrcU family type III secretion system export apparatus switch protein [Planctomycetota bacterium]
MDRQIAVALGYQPGSDLAPKVLASGQGPIAERILQIAERHGVPIEEKGELAEFLARIPLHDEIPDELYPAVAEIFAFLLRISDLESTEEA